MSVSCQQIKTFISCRNHTQHRRARWTPPSAAIVPNFHLPMRSYEVKNRTSTDDIKALRLITAIKTPYLPDGRFDLEAYDSLVNMQIEDGADGVIVGGTTGEGQLMSWDEHIMLIGHTINCFGTTIKVIGNTGSNSTREAAHATEQGFAVGMHAALHINPYYGKTSVEGMVAKNAVSISIEDLCRLSIKKEDLHLPGLIKAIKMPSSPSGRFDLKAYDSSDNRAGMLMFGLLGIQSAVESATICSLMQSNEVKNSISIEDLRPLSKKEEDLDPPGWIIPSGRSDYDSSNNGAGMLMVGLLGTQSAVESATICSLMQSNKVKNRPMDDLESPVSRLLRAFGCNDFLDSLDYLQLDDGADNEIVGGTTDEGELMRVPPAIRSAKSYLLMHSNEVENRTSMEKQVPSDHQSWSIPSRCHDVTRVAVLPRAAQIFWRPKSKFKIRTIYIFVGKLRFFMI